MVTNLIKSNRSLLICALAGMFAASTLAFGQDPSEDPPPPPPQTTQSPPVGTSFLCRPLRPQLRPHPRRRANPPRLPFPTITIPAGTFVTVRVDQYLSSDKNKAGDGFSASLARPLVADGVQSGVLQETTT